MFPSVIPLCRTDCSRVTHPSATGITDHPAEALSPVIPVRLACVKHAASVRPEPGSNSDVQSFPLRRPYSLRLAKASAFRPASWRFTHRILTVLPSRFLAPASWPSSQFRDPSSFPLYRFQGSLAARSSGFFSPCLADSFASITKNPRLVNH